VWWSLSLLIQGGFVFLTFFQPRDWQIAFAWLPLAPVMSVTLVLLTLLILLRSRAPWILFGGTLALVLAFAFGYEPRVSLVGVLFLMTFSGALAFSTVSMRTAVATASGAVAVFTVGVVVVRGVTVFHLIPLLMGMSMVIALAVGQLMTARKRLLSSTLRRAAEAERTREALAATRVAEQRLATARDLHDTVGHELAVINLYARVASEAVGSEPGSARDSLLLIEQSAARITDEIRELLNELRRTDAPLPASSSIRETLPRLAATLSAGGLRVDIGPAEDLPILPAPVDEAVYRILEEALVNAYKHGEAGEPVHAAITADARSVRLAVTNPVAEDAGPASSSGFGLIGVEERARALGGSSLVTVEDGVFALRVDIPVARP
jgi:signal transduction histidine kinase